MKKIYCIGIGGIGVSALARYYLSEGYKVYGSDAHDSSLIQALKQEGMNIIIGSSKDRITPDFEKIIYTEAIPSTQEELVRAKELGFSPMKYNEALAQVVNPKKLIAISGTHGKSTTTSLISLILKNSEENFSTVVGTLLKEFDGKNFYSQKKSPNTPEYFSIEACEYKEHFLLYTPLVLVITNIEYDHADYFHTPEKYVQAFEKMIYNVQSGGFVIYCAEDTNAAKLVGIRKDITYIGVTQESFSIQNPSLTTSALSHFPEIKMQVPGDHVLLDAKLAYVVAHMIGISDEIILQTLSDYTGVWRRMEIIGTTDYGNILMSDYGHHPTEISVTLKALKKGYPQKKIFILFQPHQYSRTIELLEEFKDCFSDADTVLVPNIYASRDSGEDMQKISAESFVQVLHHTNSFFGNGFEHSLKMLEEYEKEKPNSSIILLQGAGDIDTLRYKIKTR